MHLPPPLPVFMQPLPFMVDEIVVGTSKNRSTGQDLIEHFVFDHVPL